MNSKILNPGLGGAYRLALKAFWALKWPISGFLLLYLIVNAGFWAAYYGLMYEFLSTRIESVHDASLIMQNIAKIPGTFFHFASTVPILLVLHHFIDGTQSSLWSGLKATFQRWQALLVTILMYALLSIFSYHINFSLLETELARFTLDLFVSAGHGLIILTFVGLILSNSTLANQSKRLWQLSWRSWTLILTSLALLTVFFWVFDDLIQSLEANLGTTPAALAQLFAVSYLDQLVSTMMVAVVYISVLMQFSSALLAAGNKTENSLNELAASSTSSNAIARSEKP